MTLGIGSRAGSQKVDILLFQVGENSGTFCFSGCGRAEERLGRNRLVTVIQEDPDAGGALTAPDTDYAYDDAGQFTSVTGPLGRVTTNLYDTWAG
jgi:YD repeat-containing protein